MLPPWAFGRKKALGTDIAALYALCSLSQNRLSQDCYVQFARRTVRMVLLYYYLRSTVPP